MKIEVDIQWEDEEKEYYLIEDVVLEAEPFWQDDSFDYAGTHCTGGKSGTCKIPKYLTLEDRPITWDKKLYSEEENSRIQAYVNDNHDSLEEKFCEKVIDQMNDYWD